MSEAETTGATSELVDKDKASREKTEKKFKFFTVFTIPVLIGLMTLLLSLMGYGRDLGYLSEFELGPEQLQRTPMDFLLRGHFGIFGMLDFDSKYLGALFSAELATKLWWSTLPAVFVLSMLAMSGFLLGYRFLPRSSKVAALHNPRRPGWLRRPAIRLRSDEGRDTKFRLYIYGAPFVFGIGVPGLLMFIAVIIWFVMSLFLMPYVLVPLGPARMGQEAAKVEVIRPRLCHPVGKAGEGAHCIRVVRNGCEIARGRYIDQSANRVWLFHKRDHSTTSAPLDGNVTEDVGTEDVPLRQPDCS